MVVFRCFQGHMLGWRYPRGKKTLKPFNIPSYHILHPQRKKTNAFEKVKQTPNPSIPPPKIKTSPRCRCLALKSLGLELALALDGLLGLGHLSCQTSVQLLIGMLLGLTTQRLLYQLRVGSLPVLLKPLASRWEKRGLFISEPEG